MSRVLVAPLDWGLGHTARCVPIIETLLKNDHQVYFAGNKQQIDFIQRHQLPVKVIELFGYDVTYSAIFPQWVKVGFQSLRLKKVVEKEHQWLDGIIDQYKIDIVISDNRYGLHNKKAHCIFITHQLNIPSPLLAKNINAINVDYIKRFNECWIPDHPELRLSGSLSGNKIISAAKYIGLLSRFSKHKKAGDEKFDVLLLLSGVEPQRTILEEKLINYFQNTNHSVALVRGTKEQMTTLPSHITPFGLLCSEELKELIGQSNTVICRSGYSSIMDLVMLQKKMFLVPTPGQPEQEYLAEYLHQKYGIPYMEQQAIAKQVFALDSSKAIELPFGIKNENLLEGAIAKLPK